MNTAKKEDFVEKKLREFEENYTALGEPKGYRYWPSDVEPKEVITFLRTALLAAREHGREEGRKEMWREYISKI